MKDITIFNTLGWETKRSGSQLVCLCPFCGKKKMYIDPSKTTFQCKVCEEKGNSNSVIELMFEKVYRPALEKTNKLKKIASKRGLPKKAFLNDHNLGYDEEKEELVWIVRDVDGKVVSMRHAKKVGDGYRVMNIKGMSLGIIGIENTKGFDKKVPIYVVEGEWDRIAGNWMLKKTKQKGHFVALPGAGTFKKKEWSHFFDKKQVVLCLDNDDAGVKGTKRTGEILINRSDTLYYLDWDDKREGCDINDLVSDEGVKGAWEFFCENVLDEIPYIEVDNSAQETQHEQQNLEPISIEELHKTFHKWLKLENCDLLDIVVATMFTLTLPGDPLWFLIVSPPSASKSETLIPVSKYYRCHPLSNVTAKALISGSAMGGGDPSLMAKLDGVPSALVIKDLTPLLQGKDNERDEVFGILRDAYDGSAQKMYGNGILREYEDLHFSVVAGVTPSIDAFGSVAMGERFLKFRADRELERYDDKERAMKAIFNSGQEDEMKKELQDACVRTLIKEFDIEDIPKVDDEFAHVISDLAIFCAKMRAVAPSDRYSDIQDHTPIAEAPTRLAKQFTKLAQGLAIHYEVDSLLDERVLRLVKRVVIHTPDIITMRIIQCLWENNDLENVNVMVLAGKLSNLSADTIKETLKTLVRTNSVLSRNTVEGKKVYCLTEQMYEIIENNKLFKKLPKNDPLYLGKRLKIVRKK